MHEASVAYVSGVHTACDVIGVPRTKLAVSARWINDGVDQLMYKKASVFDAGERAAAGGASRMEEVLANEAIKAKQEREAWQAQRAAANAAREQAHAAEMKAMDVERARNLRARADVRAQAAPSIGISPREKEQLVAEHARIAGLPEHKQHEAMHGIIRTLRQPGKPLASLPDEHVGRVVDEMVNELRVSGPMTNEQVDRGVAALEGRATAEPSSPQQRAHAALTRAQYKPPAPDVRRAESAKIDAVSNNADRVMQRNPPPAGLSDEPEGINPWHVAGAGAGLGVAAGAGTLAYQASRSPRNSEG